MRTATTWKPCWSRVTSARTVMRRDVRTCSCCAERNRGPGVSLPHAQFETLVTVCSLKKRVHKSFQAQTSWTRLITCYNGSTLPSRLWIPTAEWRNRLRLGLCGCFSSIMHVSESPLSRKKKNKKKQFNPEGLGNKQNKCQRLTPGKSKKKTAK